MKSTWSRMGAIGTSMEMRKRSKQMTRLAKHMASLPKDELARSIDSAMSCLSQHPRAAKVTAVTSLIATSLLMSFLLNQSVGLAEASMGNATTTMNMGDSTMTQTDHAQNATTTMNMHMGDHMASAGPMTLDEHLKHIRMDLTPQDYADPHLLIAKVDHGSLAGLLDKPIDIKTLSLDERMAYNAGAEVAKTAHFSKDTLNTVGQWMLTGNVSADQMEPDGKFSQAVEDLVLQFHQKAMTVHGPGALYPEFLERGFTDEVRNLINR